MYNNKYISIYLSKNITLQLGHNPINCNCPFIEIKSFNNESQMHLKYSVDDFNCADLVANNSVINFNFHIKKPSQKRHFHPK